MACDPSFIVESEGLLMIICSNVLQNW